MEYQDNVQNDPMFKPDLDEDRSVFKCSVDYTKYIQYAERYQDSNYVIAQSIKLILECNGITDPSRIPSLSGVHRMRTNVGEKALEEHEKKTKGLQFLKLGEKKNIRRIWLQPVIHATFRDNSSRTRYM